LKGIADVQRVNIRSQVIKTCIWYNQFEVDAVKRLKPAFDIMQWMETNFGLTGTSAGIALAVGALLIIFLLNMLMTPRR